MTRITSEKRELDRLHVQIPVDLLYRDDLPPGLSRGTMLLIYAVLDDHCAKNGEKRAQSWPGYSRLVEKTGTGRSQISATLKWLESIGKLQAVGNMIETHDRKGKTIMRMKVNEWVLTARLVPQQNQGSPVAELDGSPAERLELKPLRTNMSTNVDVATLREDVESDVPGPDYDPTQAEWESWTELKRRKWGLQFKRSILDVYWEEHKRAFGVPPKFSLHGKPNSSALIGAIGHRLETAWPSQIRAVFRYAFAVRESVDRFVSDNRGNPLALLSDGVFNRISLVADEWFPDA